MCRKATGIFTRLLLTEAKLVYAAEPNPEMRAIAERDLSSFPNYRSVIATAEHTRDSLTFAESITRYGAMISALEALFEAYKVGEGATMELETKLFLGGYESGK
ncbi:MAG TPA: hypothetical protein VI895_01140 [Bdellovibrionota bacterium]|nr:hypothetical protein [Bdellovibrionota bacterium]